MSSSTGWCKSLALSGAVRGPYTKPLLPALGRTIREGYTPLWVRGLEPRELAVIEGQREREVKSWLSLIFRGWRGSGEN